MPVSEEEARWGMQHPSQPVRGKATDCVGKIGAKHVLLLLSL